MARNGGKRKERGMLPLGTGAGLSSGADPGGLLAREAVLTAEVAEEVLAGEQRTHEELIAQEAMALAPQGAQPGEAVAAPGLGADVATLTLWGDVWRRLRKNRLAIIGLGIIILLALTAIFAPLIAPYKVDQTAPNLPLAAKCFGGCAPSFKHWMGTDTLGRDYFSLTVYGARTSVIIGLSSVLLSLIIGVAMGAIAGYYGGRIDGAIMRLADVFFAYPFILAAIVILTVLGDKFNRLAGLIMAIGILGWATVARLLRASILQVKNADFIEAARALGAENRRILLRHILPNSIAPVIVFATILTGGVILTEASLSFLGLGVPPGTAAWGKMVAEGKSAMTSQPWLVIFPGLAIVTTVMGFIFVGDGLRDSMDPRLR